MKDYIWCTDDHYQSVEVCQAKCSKRKKKKCVTFKKWEGENGEQDKGTH